jgi:hypothetical protein
LFSFPQPIPQLTIPIRYQIFLSSAITRGPPESPCRRRKKCGQYDKEKGIKN